jgi:tryptophan 7-halogenase
MVKTITVVGGGTAGFVSALYLRASLPQLKITLVESSKIGIIGVGEGSTEHWQIFMKAVGTQGADIIKHCGATFKTGIRFDNWQGDGTHYYHSLSEQFSKYERYTGIGYTMMRLVAEGSDPLKTVWPSLQASTHRKPFYETFGQYHFDTFKLNAYFHKLCKERQIDIVDDEIVDVKLDEEGFVSSVTGTSGKSYPSDFYIDASGFKRIISSKLGAKWIDCSDQLPMNSAIAFPTSYQEFIPSYTISKAMNAGWRWRIPTQERFGNGYVFCDSFINETQAFDEVQAEFDEPLEVGRKFKFSAGYADKFWIKNCVSMGLASMFVEPLEASSIGSTIQMIRGLVPSLALWDREETSSVKIYNKSNNDIVKNIIDFIQLHYFVKRDDTEFWKWCKHNIKITDFNQEYLERFKTKFIGVSPFAHNQLIMFTGLNFAQVMHGLNLFDSEKIKHIYENSIGHMTTTSKFDITDQDPGADIFTHRQALEEIKRRSEAWTIK